MLGNCKFQLTFLINSFLHFRLPQFSWAYIFYNHQTQELLFLIVFCCIAKKIVNGFLKTLKEGWKIIDPIEKLIGPIKNKPQ